jgi:hypothetical protein
VWYFVAALHTNFLYVLVVLTFPRGYGEPQYYAVLSQGIICLRVRGLGRPNTGRAPLADQFPGRWLLAFGCWIMALKIDTLEMVLPHVAIAAGVGRKAILHKWRVRAETARC